MKIAVLAHAHFPIKIPYQGGLEAHTHQLVNELVAAGHEVTLFAKAGSNTAAKHVTIFRGNPIDGKNPFYDKAYLYAVKRIKLGQFDLIINNSLNHVPLLKHSDTMPHMITIFHTPPLPKMLKVLEKSRVALNRTYIAVSSYTAEQWQPYIPDHVRTVPNGVDMVGWEASERPPKNVSASWVGRITPEKGTHLAIQACINMQLPLTLAGCVYDKKYFNNIIRPLLKNPLVTYVGHADRAQVNKIYRESSVALVTPLWEEPFGLVAVEALAAGTPVAALSKGGLTSIIENHVGALAAEDSIEALQTAIRTAIGKSRSACVRHAHENYTLQRMVMAYLNCIPVTNELEIDDLAWAPIP